MSNNKQIFPVYQSLTRPMFLMGGERESVLFVVMFCLILAGVGGELIITALAVILLIVGLFVCQILAKHDPNMTKIYIRSVRYEDFYPATEKLDTPSIKPERHSNVTEYHT